MRGVRKVCIQRLYESKLHSLTQMAVKNMLHTCKTLDYFQNKKIFHITSSIATAIFEGGSENFHGYMNKVRTTINLKFLQFI